MKKFVLIILAFAVLVTGCATFNNMVKNDALISQLAVESATARVINDHPLWKDKAIEIVDAAINAIDSRSVVELGILESYVRSRVSWSRLLPEEQALVSALISQTRKNLEDSFLARGIDDPGLELVEVRQVLVWIRDTAKRQR